MKVKRINSVAPNLTPTLTTEDKNEWTHDELHDLQSLCCFSCHLFSVSGQNFILMGQVDEDGRGILPAGSFTALYKASHQKILTSLNKQPCWSPRLKTTQQENRTGQKNHMTAEHEWIRRNDSIKKQQSGIKLVFSVLAAIIPCSAAQCLISQPLCFGKV